MVCVLYEEYEVVNPQPWASKFKLHILSYGSRLELGSGVSAECAACK